MVTQSGKSVTDQANYYSKFASREPAKRDELFQWLSRVDDSAKQTCSGFLSWLRSSLTVQSDVMLFFMNAKFSEMKTTDRITHKEMGSALAPVIA